MQPVTARLTGISAAENRRRWSIVTLLFFGILISYVDRGNFSIAAVPISQEFGFSPAVIGTLMSAFFLAYGLCQIPAGMAIDRFGYRWTYGLSFFVWSLAGAAASFASTYNQFLICRFVLGIGEAVAPVASLAYIKRHFDEDEQGLPTGIYLAGMTMGPAIGAFIGGALLERLGWRSLFLITGLAPCLWLGPWFLLAPRRLEPLAGSGPARTPFPWRGFASSPVPWGLAIGVFFYSYFWYFFLNWMPSFLVMEHHFTFARMGAILAIPLATMAVVTTMSGKLADAAIHRSGNAMGVRRRFVVTGFLIASLLLLTQFLPSATAILPIMLVSLIGLGIAGSNFWALSQVVTPSPLIGRVIGYQNMVAQLAGVVAPALTGLLLGPTKDFRLSITFAALSPLIAAAAVKLLITRKIPAAAESGS